MHFHEVALQSNDLDGQQAFYTEVLGLPVGREDGALVVGVGPTRLVFTQAPAAWQHRYHFAFNVPENQLDEAIAWVAERVTVLADTQGQTRFVSAGWNAEGFYFLDAAGNVLECIARHSLPNASAQPFGTHSLLCVSEIGIGAADVCDTVETLRRDLGAPVYDGAGSDTFSAVGDEYGLLIIARQGRIWMPDSGVAATAAPVTALVEQAGRRVRLAFPPLVIE